MVGHVCRMSSILTCSGPVQDISETKVVAAANQFVSLGLKDAGYQYVNIDVRSLPSTSTLKNDYLFFW
jgi:hypothetical protein